MFHDDLLAAQAAILNRLHGTGNVKFMMTMIRRQAASCLFGLAPLLRDILTRRIPMSAVEEADVEVPEQGLTIDQRIEQQVRSVLSQAEKLDPYDPKLQALKRIIKEKQELPSHRIMLFSSFRHTLTYLLDHLELDGLRVGLVHGDIPDEDRIEVRRRFTLERDHPEALDVMLFSEVGSEGLDYQFCDCIVNYDLPWNPMRIEQRIGRIDRRGQKSEAVRIFNMITPGTVDADIYQRCLLRIGIFDRELGASDEILGQISRELRNIAENFALSEEERREKLHQLADNQVRLIREQQELEDRQAELFAIRLPSDQKDQDLRDATSYWLSPSMLENLVGIYLKTTCGPDQDYIIGDKPLKTLRLSQDEEGLASAVEAGRLPLSVAVKIATGSDHEVQQALAEAYEKGDLRGDKLRRARRVITLRIAKLRKAGKIAQTRRKLTGEALVREYKDRMREQRQLVKKANLTKERLLLLTSAIRRLMEDEHFTTLLRAENLVDMPEQIAVRLA